MIKGLPEKLKEQREKYHYSQKYVADQLHVSPSIISGYETGERTPSTEKLWLFPISIIVLRTIFLAGNMMILKQ